MQQGLSAQVDIARANVLLVQLRGLFEQAVFKVAHQCAVQGKLDPQRLDEHQVVCYEIALAGAELLRHDHIAAGIRFATLAVHWLAALALTYEWLSFSLSVFPFTRPWGEQLQGYMWSVLLHIGGGQWYKNTEGVIHLYDRYVAQRVAAGQTVLPLWMVSPAPSPAVQSLIDALPVAGKVRFFHGLATDAIEALYSLAGALLFPSHAEGFGWPIAEALACGCPVLTTGQAPMQEVGGPHAHYLPRLANGSDTTAWATDGARLLCALLDRPGAERDAAARAGIEWTQRFDAQRAIDGYLRIYESVLQGASHTAGRPGVP